MPAPGLHLRPRGGRAAEVAAAAHVRGSARRAARAPDWPPRRATARPTPARPPPRRHASPWPATVPSMASVSDGSCGRDGLNGRALASAATATATTRRPMVRRFGSCLSLAKTRAFSRHSPSHATAPPRWRRPPLPLFLCATSRHRRDPLRRGRRVDGTPVRSGVHGSGHIPHPHARHLTARVCVARPRLWLSAAGPARATTTSDETTSCAPTVTVGLE